MANIDSTTLNSSSRFMSDKGNAKIVPGSIALTANPVAADVLRVLRIAAGTTVVAVQLANGDLDSNGTPTIVFSMGYAPVVAADGPAASTAYFQAAGDATLQAANAGKVYANFAPITFEKDVYLTMTVATASATFAAGTIFANVHGIVRGIK